MIAAWFFVFRKIFLKQSYLHRERSYWQLEQYYGYVVAKGLRRLLSDPTLLSSQMLGLNFTIGFSVVVSLIFPLHHVIFKVDQAAKGSWSAGSSWRRIDLTNNIYLLQSRWADKCYFWNGANKHEVSLVISAWVAIQSLSVVWATICWNSIRV